MMGASFALPVARVIFIGYWRTGQLRFLKRQLCARQLLAAVGDASKVRDGQPSPREIAPALNSADFYLIGRPDSKHCGNHVFSGAVGA